MKKSTSSPKTTKSSNVSKDEALNATLAQIEKDYGKGTIMKLGSTNNMEVEALSTGILSLDIALGIGGLPKGRIVEVYGPESCGKTTLTLLVAAECQRNDGVVAFVDAEHALDPDYAKTLGVDIDELLVSQPDTGEQALAIVEALVRSSAVDLIVVDSVAALVPKAEIDGEMDEQQVGLQARLMSKALRKLAGIINKTNTIVIFINQLREKVGVMFGNPETTTGGMALKFYSSVRLDIRKGDAIKEGGTIIGSRTKVKVVKNKVAPPFKRAEYDMIYGQGFSPEGVILDMAIDADIINKAGAWISYNGNKIAQGRENAKQYLIENPEVLAEVKAKVLSYYTSGNASSEELLIDDMASLPETDDAEEYVSPDSVTE